MATTNVVIPKSASAVNQTIYAAQATAASGNAGPFPVDFFSSAEVTVAVTTCSGTLNVYVQKLLPDNATYDDIASFAQWTTAIFTTTGTYTLSFVNAGNTLNQQKSQSLTVNTALAVHFGAYWNIAFVVGGTGGTSTFGIYGNFQE